MYDYMKAYAGDWFAYTQVTDRMVRTLEKIGPGGVIIADALDREFRTVHSRRVDPADRTRFIVYGHGDLVRELPLFTEEFADQAWEYLVPAIDETSRDCLDEWLHQAAYIHRTAVRLRQEMNARGFDLNGRTRYSTVAQRRAFTDHYADRAHPRLTVTVKVPYAHPRGALSLVRVYDQGHHATGWPRHISNPLMTEPAAHQVREAVDTYQRRTRA
ncbi:hypothetical protein KIK06_14885 [Nocardiopsis sp. EMB25]|uniref:hypothetical protein n=1 Tax=Nocardiopsis sp. EMB25 TaxID=2835867 RepID=UPI0022848F08|nr:hypothetical protein [Nocardiopsis sp. EMB25]MCY9785168.1 hypothetical protein [Nocardiopsis sp. EMB25]